PTSYAATPLTPTHSHNHRSLRRHLRTHTLRQVPQAIRRHTRRYTYGRHRRPQVNRHYRSNQLDRPRSLAGHVHHSLLLTRGRILRMDRTPPRKIRRRPSNHDVHPTPTNDRWNGLTPRHRNRRTLRSTTDRPSIGWIRDRSRPIRRRRSLGRKHRRRRHNGWRPNQHNRRLLPRTLIQRIPPQYRPDRAGNPLSQPAHPLCKESSIPAQRGCVEAFEEQRSPTAQP